RGLAVLDALTPAALEGAARFLRGRLMGQADLVDLFSLVYSLLLVRTAGGPDLLAECAPDWPDRVIAALELHRAQDGGYAKAPGAKSGSTYNSFLVALAHQLLGKELLDSERLLAFVRSRRRDDGGYVEIAPMRRSGTNPTAAAVGLLQILLGDALDP